MREFLNSAVQKKYILMFFTSVIYILGLFAFFSDLGIYFALIIAVAGIFAIFKNYLSPKLVLFWYFMFFFAFFNASFKIKNYDTLYQLAPQNVTIEGQIVSIPTSVNKDKTKFFFNVSSITRGQKSENTKSKTYVNIYSPKGDFSDLNIGDTYKIEGKLRTPFKASNPSQFDYGKYLKNFNTFTVFYADKSDCTLIPKKLTPKWSFLQNLNNIRNGIIQTHSQYLKSPNLEILGGIVFGDDAVSPPEFIKKAFRNSGLLHILAASGMNVALIYGIWFFILRKLKVPFNLTVTSGIFVIIFYAFMTGLGPSVIRASFMLIFILIGKLIDRDAHSISLLSFVALLMLIYNPAYINDVGFQLSFMVTFGLLITAPAVFEKVKALPNWLSGAIFIPLVAQIWVAPIQMYYFNSFSLYSIFANIISVPFVSIISFGGFASSVLALIKPISSGVCYIFDLVLNPVISGLVFVSEYFSNLPHSLIATTQPNVFQIFLYYGIVLCLTLLFKNGKSKKIIITALTFTVLLTSSLIKIPDKDFETIVFDVQNADAFLVKSPRGKYFIIDSAKSGYNGAKTQAQAIILEYLKDEGIKNVEALILTHFDSDHAGGAVDLINNLKIKKVYVNSIDDSSKIAKEIYKSAKARNVELLEGKNNTIVYTEPDFCVKTFAAGMKQSNDDNENSIITLFSHFDFDELFMGDAGIVAYEKIKKDLPQKIEILKVGHHGAKDVLNKKMLDELNPDVAVISTGQNNYGHPNGYILKLLENARVRTFRTDKQNSIKIEAKKSGYKVSGFDRTIHGYVEKMSHK